MAEDRSEPREINWRQLLPWTILFQGFRVALDPNKLILAAAGILAMAFGWWLLAVVFFNTAKKPQDWPGDYLARQSDEKVAWSNFKSDRQHWNLMYRTAGTYDSKERVDPGDLARTPRGYTLITMAKGLPTSDRDKPIVTEVRDMAKKQDITQEKAATQLLVAAEDLKSEAQAQQLINQVGAKKPAGLLRSWPWSEDRGPNPYLLVTGQARTEREADQGVLNWVVTEQAPVLLEPLVKLFRPVIYFFSPGATALSRFYFLLVMIWTLAVWALFGGAITRIAAVQVTRQEKISAVEAVRFTLKRYVSYVTAPLFPLIIVALIVLIMIIFGFFHMIPMFGDIVVDGLFWWLLLMMALAMAVVLVGLIGWPLMAATISTEGTDTWEAVSRSYSYVFQAPWHYIFYSVLALLYGVVIVFFVGFMGSFTVYLAKWGVSQTPWIQTANRDPAYLFVYAPTSFGWRELLLSGGTVEGENLVQNGRINQEAYDRLTGEVPREKYDGKDRMSWWNQVGAFLVSIWLCLMFLLILGFGYSYFWSAGTIIYLLMRRKVDDAEMDEVYLEEEDQDLPFAPAPAPAASPAPAPTPGGASLQMVDAPALRTPAPPPAPMPAPAVTSRPEQAPLPPADKPVNPPSPQNDGGTTPPSGAV